MPATTFLRAAAVAALLAAAGCQGGDDDALSVVISLPSQQLPPAAKATLLVDYSGTGARLLSEGGGPACAFILPGVDGEFSDDRQGTLTIVASGPRATRGPADIAACRMKAGDEGATAADLASRLSVRVEAAEDAAGKPLDLVAAATKNAAGGGPGATRMTEDDIEEAQAKAVKAAETISRAAQNEAAANPSGETGGPGTATGPTGGFGPGASVPAPKPAPVTAKPAAPGNIARGPGVPTGGVPAVVDDSAMPGADRDPGYDDSPADDPSVQGYSVDFHVQTPGTFGALQLDITHLGNSGGFIGREDKVDCVPLVEAIVASNYLGEREVKIGLISLQGIKTPADIMRCGFRTSENLSPGSFLVEVTDASDTESKQIEPAPRVLIRTITPRR
jgi:hypothetical protein